MRMANEDDQRIVHAAVSDPANRLLGFLASLGTAKRWLRRRRAGCHPVAVQGTADGFNSDLGSGLGRPDRQGHADRSNLVASVVARWRGIAMSNKPVAAPPIAPAAEPAGLDLNLDHAGIEVAPSR